MIAHLFKTSLLCLILAVVGCGKEESPAPDGTLPNPAKVAGGGGTNQTKLPNAKGSTAGTGQPVSAEDIDAKAKANAAKAAPVVEAMLKGLGNGQPVAVWDALPAPFQKDLNDLARQFLASIDPQVRLRAFASSGRVGKVMAEKKALLLPVLQSLPQSRQPEHVMAKLVKYYDGVAMLAATISQSEMATIAWQGAPDLGKVLTADGGKLLSHGLALAGDDDLLAKLNDFKSAAVKPGAPQGGNPTVIITTTRSVSTNVVARFDDKWLPLAALPLMSQVAQWKAGLSAKPMNAQAKAALLAELDTLDGALTTVEQAVNIQQVDRAVIGLTAVSRLLGGKGAVAAQPTTPAQPTAATAPGRKVAWNFGGGEATTRIDGFLRRKQEEVTQVLGTPDNQFVPPNVQQVEVYWLYENMQINDLKRNVRGTRVAFGFKDGVVVDVRVQ